MTIMRSTMQHLLVWLDGEYLSTTLREMFVQALQEHLAKLYPYARIEVAVKFAVTNKGQPCAWVGEAPFGQHNPLASVKLHNEVRAFFHEFHQLPRPEDELQPDGILFTRDPLRAHAPVSVAQEAVPGTARGRFLVTHCKHGSYGVVADNAGDAIERYIAQWTPYQNSAEMLAREGGTFGELRAQFVVTRQR